MLKPTYIQSYQVFEYKAFNNALLNTMTRNSHRTEMKYLFCSVDEVERRHRGYTHFFRVEDGEVLSIVGAVEVVSCMVV